MGPVYLSHIKELYNTTLNIYETGLQTHLTQVAFAFIVSNVWKCLANLGTSRVKSA
jgi:hypothetical protein